MQKNKIIQLLKAQEDYLKKRYFIESLSVFGSYARQTQHADSDIDLLYATKEGADMTLARLSSLENYLSNLLSIKKVEMVSRNNLNPIVQLNMKDDVIHVF